MKNIRKEYGIKASYEEIINTIDKADTGHIIVNKFMEENDIYYMTSLDDLLEGYTPTEILYKALYGGEGKAFNPNHDYFKIDGYQNIQSIYEYDFTDLLIEYIYTIKNLYIDRLEYEDIKDDIIYIIDSIS